MQSPKVRAALPAEVERALARIENAKNAALIRRYAVEKMVNGAKPGTLQNVVGDLRALAEVMGERAITASTRDDISTFLSLPGQGVGGPRVTNRRAKPLAASTRAKRAFNVRGFYRWLGKPKLVEWVKPKRQSKPSVEAEDLLTRDELAAMMDAARTTRDRAIIALFAESGLRKGELTSLRVGSVQVAPDGAIRVSLPSADGLKTGRRAVLLFDCAGLVLSWLREHGGREWQETDKHRWLNAPLFHSWKADEPLKEWAIYNVVKHAAQRAGIRKNVKPHLLRFGAATHDAKRGMPVAAMVKKFGWSDQSRHALYYSRLAASDVEEWERRQRGLAPDAPIDASVIKPVICSRCGYEDRPGARFCGRCARPLSHDAQQEVEAERQDALKRLIAEEIRQALKTR